MVTHNKQDRPHASSIIKSIGLVFGDIGTSPIYTLAVLFAFTKPTVENIIGVASLIIWTLTILVSIKYASLAMSLGRNGEGGTIVLKEILCKLLKGGKSVVVVSYLSILGVALLIGDGVITPAISILSAVEGITLIPGMSSLTTNEVVMISIVIAVALFSFQDKGTDKIASAFGPIMIVWFLTLTATGAISIANYPTVLKAVNPYYGLSFLLHDGPQGFLVLSNVILCATGAEALYADMGHLGKKPIVSAWRWVSVALIVNYLGQGAFLALHPGSRSPLFEMVKDQSLLLYVPFAVLTIMATIIASQALISGVFSIVYQAITTRLLPMFEVRYTSSHLKSQIYIGAVNWALMGMVIVMMLIFRKSESLAAAYGLAATGTMTVTDIMMIAVFSKTTKKWKVPLTVAITVIDFVFLYANLHKIPSGGYISLIVASVPLAIILIWTKGLARLQKSISPLPIDVFIESYQQIYAKNKNIAGTALFFIRDASKVHPYVADCIIRSGIVYERNVLICIKRTDEPAGIGISHEKEVASGLEIFTIKAGYMVKLDIEAILQHHDINERVIFYGIEEISTSNPVWSVFALAKRMSANFMQFNKLPAQKIQGILSRVEM